MSVNAQLTLPAQPAIGSVEIRPLGGNGYSSPQSAYIVKIFSIVNDASAGTASLDLFMDPQYEGVFSVIGVAIASPAASAQVRFDFFDRASAAAGITKLEIPGTASFASDTASSCFLTPPPMFDVARLSVITDNVDTQTLRLSAIIYNFRRDAAQRTPLSILLASLPRGFAITGPFV